MNSTLKWLIAAGIIFVIFLSFYGMFKGFYNTSIELQQGAKTSWGNVESSYQRRNDLIGNLVQTVQGAANFEKSTLTAVIEARANATQVKIDPKNLTAEQMAKFQSAQGELGSALGRLMVVVEQYPQLKANQNFLELQSQLEGTENRIAVERQKFNEAVQLFKCYVRKFPQVTIAGMYGFSPKSFFEADKGANKAPDVGAAFDK